jgi:tetratricopeptide (TPR) repeat protein
MLSVRSRQILKIIFGVALLVVTVGLNAWIAHRLSYPPVELRVRIVTDSLERVQQGITPYQLRQRVQKVSKLFEREAGIRLSVVGFTDVRIGRDLPEPETLRHYLQLHTPREEADLLVAFWPTAPNEKRLGGADPFTSVAVIRLEAGSPEKDISLLAHQIGRLYGLPDSRDPRSIMNAAPSELNLDTRSRAILMEHRLFDFGKGLAGMKGRMKRRILASFREEGRGKEGNATSYAYRHLGELLIRDRQYSAALEQFRHALAADFTNVTNHIETARALALSEQYPEAIGEAKTAIGMDPNNSDAHYELGHALVRFGNADGAVVAFRKAIALAPNTARYHAGLAVAYAGVIGEFDASAQEFQEAQRLDPRDPVIKADLLYVSHLRETLERELALAGKMAAASPNNLEVQLRWAMLLLRLGHVDEGMAEVQKAIAAGPETWQMHYAMAIGWYSKGKPADAQTEFRRAQELGSGSRPVFEQSLQAALAQKGA